MRECHSIFKTLEAVNYLFSLVSLRENDLYKKIPRKFSPPLPKKIATFNTLAFPCFLICGNLLISVNVLACLARLRKRVIAGARLYTRVRATNDKREQLEDISLRLLRFFDKISRQPIT